MKTVVTGWFRMRRVLPFIAQHLAALERPVTVWSAACASGEEAYSLAIMLEREGIDGRVLTSDMNPQLVAAAQKARHPRQCERHRGC